MDRDSEDFRRARDVAAWILLAAMAVLIVMGTWEFLDVPGAPFPESTFALRSYAAFTSLVAFKVTALPVAAVLLVTFVGRPAAAARQITRVAVILQAVALSLGLIAWAASLGAALVGRWFAVSGASDLAVAGAGLILTSAVLRRY
jgi:hypothetical protein